MKITDKELIKYKFLKWEYTFEEWVRIYVYFCATTLYFNLFLPVMQEEGIYLISAMEMHQNGNYLVATNFGAFYGRPPLVNWLIIAISEIIGWENILWASRFINITATVLTGFLVFDLSKKLTGKTHVAYLGCAAYFSWTVLVKSGWLAYADSTLSLGVMIGFYGLWLGIERKNNWYLLLAALGICFGFLAKALTPFVLYGFFGLSLLMFHKNRWFLLKPISITIGLCALAFPVLFALMADPKYLEMMLATLSSGTKYGGVMWYLDRFFWQIPSQFILTIYPLGLLALYRIFYLKYKKVDITLEVNLKQNFRIALCGFLFGFLPVWFSWSQWPEVRYYLPVLPLISIVFMYLINGMTNKQKKVGFYLLVVMMCIKLLTILGFYIFYNIFRLDYYHIAQQSMSIVKNNSISIPDNSANFWSAFDSVLLPSGRILENQKNLDTKYRYILIPGRRNKLPQLKSNQKIVKIFGTSYQPEAAYLIVENNINYSNKFQGK